MSRVCVNSASFLTPLSRARAGVHGSLRPLPRTTVFKERYAIRSHSQQVLNIFHFEPCFEANQLQLPQPQPHFEKSRFSARETPELLENLKFSRNVRNIRNDDLYSLTVFEQLLAVGHLIYTPYVHTP